MSMIVAESIGLLYKLNLSFMKLFLKRYILIHPYLSYGIEAWHGINQNNTSKIFVLQNKATRAINNLAYNDTMNIPTHTSNLTRYSNFLISISFKFRTMFFKYYTPILVKK